LVVFVLAFAFLMPMQQQRYSTRPGASSGKVRGVPKHIPSATEFISDGEFLKQTAADNAFLTAVEKWTKEQRAGGDVRHTASEMLAEDQRLGDEIRKLAGRKHVTLSDTRNEEDAAALSDMEGLHASEAERFFIDQVSLRCQLEIARFQTEAQEGNDPDIRKWASGQIAIFDRHVEMLRTLKQPRREP
jgi:putative membrane protein